MTLTVEETQELIETRNHVREAVLALEVCFVCERVSECEQGTFDNAAAWLCGDCSQGKPPAVADPVAQFMSGELAKVTWAGLSHLHEGGY